MDCYFSGPVENSVEDFWRMVWEQHCPTIVMLTRIFEGRVSEFKVFINMKVTTAISSDSSHFRPNSP